MPVILETPFSPPVPTYDRIHLDHLTLTIEKSSYAKAQIQARVRMYYQHPETNEKFFSQDYKEIFIGDAEAFAMNLAQVGDMRGISAMNNIAELVGILVETQTNLGNVQIL
jgi:hypothetical protein